MAAKDIPDAWVCAAIFVQWVFGRGKRWPHELLADFTGQPEKVAYRALERSSRKGLVESGVSLRSGWLTEAGIALLEETK